MDNSSAIAMNRAVLEILLNTPFLIIGVLIDVLFIFAK